MLLPAGPAHAVSQQYSDASVMSGFCLFFHVPSWVASLILLVLRESPIPLHDANYEGIWLALCRLPTVTSGTQLDEGVSDMLKLPP